MFTNDTFRGISHIRRCGHSDCELCCAPSTSTYSPQCPAIAQSAPIIRQIKSHDGTLVPDPMGRVALSAEDVDAFRASPRLIGTDPGVNNIITTAELGRRRLPGCHRAPIHSFLSLNVYEKRTMRRSHQKWEARRRVDNPVYGQAILKLSRAGTWATKNAETLDQMCRAVAHGWRPVYQELVECKDHVSRKMVMYRKRRMLLDQTVRRMLNPTKDHVADKKTRAVVVGYGNASFKSRGPRVLLIKALVRGLKTQRAEGRPAAMVFIDEFRTTLLCHRCHRETHSPTKKKANYRGRVEDRRFRDCPHCGTQAAPKRWGRDSNAALNMLMKLMALMDGVDVPRPFKRPAAAAVA